MTINDKRKGCVCVSVMCVCVLYVSAGVRIQGDNFLGVLEALSWLPAWICSSCQVGRQAEDLLLMTKGLVLGQRPSRCPTWTVAPPSPLRTW